VSFPTIGSQVGSLPVANIIATHQELAKERVWDRLKSDMRPSHHENQENPAICVARIDDSFHQEHNDLKIELSYAFLCYGVEAMITISHRAMATSWSETRLRISLLKYVLQRKNLIINIA